MMVKCLAQAEKDFYNVSSPKQLERQDGVLFNEATHQFRSYAKTQRKGAANLLFDEKIIAPDGNILIDKQGKIITEEYKQYQDMLDEFRVHFKGTLPSKAAINRPPVPTLIKDDDFHLARSARSKKVTCCICGGSDLPASEAITKNSLLSTGENGNLSVHSNVQGPQKICIACSFVIKFLPYTAYYKTEDKKDKKSIYVFIPHFTSLDRHLALDGKDFYQNFTTELDAPQSFCYFHEILFALLYEIYMKVAKDIKAREQLTTATLPDYYIAKVMKEFPLEFITIYAQDGYIKHFGYFKDTYYVFCLFNDLSKLSCTVELKNGEKRTYKALPYFLKDLTLNGNNIQQKNLFRRDICAKMLARRSILDDVYRFACSSGKRVSAIITILNRYELGIRGGDPKLLEIQELAAKLAKTVFVALLKQFRDTKQVSRELNKAIVSLRRCNHYVAFLEQLNRLQFRHHFCVNKDFNAIFNENIFPEFKEYFILNLIRMQRPGSTGMVEQKGEED